MNELSPFRCFYRAHLARFAWARTLKRVYLAARVNALQAQHFVVWHTLHKLAVTKGWGAPVMSCIMASGANMLAVVLQRLLGRKVHFFGLRTFSEYCAISDQQSRTLVTGREVELSMPAVYPEEFRGFIHSGTWRLNVPAVDIFEVPGAQIMGKSDLVYGRDACLHHDLYDFRRDQLVEEMHGVVSISQRHGMLARLIGEHRGSVPAAISMVGSATPNYVHYLTETAPKLALIDELDDYHDVPLVIDSGLHPNIMESVRLLNSRGRPLVTLGPSELLSVDKLVVMSPVTYIPFDFKPGLQLDKLDIHPGFALYAPDGLNLVRSRLVSLLAPEGGKGKTRLFLRRSGKSRQMTNAEEVEALVQQFGFDTVEPETLSFAEQVRLFSCADVVLGQGGAAFGNIIFAPKGCHVIILSTWSPYTIYYYFSNMASLLGQRCSFILCEPVQDTDNHHRAHKGLRVPLNTLRQVIES